MLTTPDLSPALPDLLAMILVQSKILVYGFVKHEAAIALLQRGERVEGLDLVARGAEGDCLLLHAERIRWHTTDDKVVRALTISAGEALQSSCARRAVGSGHSRAIRRMAIPDTLVRSLSVRRFHLGEPTVGS